MAAPNLSEIQARAATDPEFRQRLVDDPHAVAAELGFDLPDDMKITVVESTPDHLYLAIPPDMSDQLTDEQLEGVAGGCSKDHFHKRHPGPPVFPPGF